MSFNYAGFKLGEKKAFKEYEHFFAPAEVPPPSNLLIPKISSFSFVLHYHRSSSIFNGTLTLSFSFDLQ
jgi:hypothetical protein